ncbi:MAG: DUF1330 domain-containing protein [Cellulomonas sp.]|nr:DUF1330 domain-containing protein [Cellulomonas sp.]
MVRDRVEAEPPVDRRTHVTSFVNGATDEHHVTQRKRQKIRFERRATRMSAYFVIDLDVEDGPVISDYERQVTDHIVAAGGRFLVRGNDYVQIEGDWAPKRLIIIEFPSIEAVQNYYNSEFNQQSKRTRMSGTGGKPSRAIAIAGVDQDQAGGLHEAGVDEAGSVIWK